MKNKGLKVRMEGLEPPRLAAPDPKSGTATNYATSACDKVKPEEVMVPDLKVCPDMSGLPVTPSACSLKKERKFIDNSQIQ
jgi:hypothetical protein